MKTSLRTLLAALALAGIAACGSADSTKGDTDDNVEAAHDNPEQARDERPDSADVNIESGVEPAQTQPSTARP